MAPVGIGEEKKFSGLMEEHFNDPEYCGVRVVADDGAQFHCAEYALRCGSEVFHKMLSHNMREKISGEIHIKDATSDAIRIMLSFMHSGKCCLRSTTLLPVMSIALRYQVNHLVSVCKQYQGEYFSVYAENSCCILTQVYKFPEMKQDFLKDSQNVILRNLAVQGGNKTVERDFLGLDYQIIEDISKAAIVFMFLHQGIPNGYFNFVRMLLEWLDHCKQSRASKALRLLSSLEFEALGLDGIAKISNRIFPKTNWIRQHPALEQKLLNALPNASKSFRTYAAGKKFECEPGKWSFVCRMNDSKKRQGVNTVMVTFELEETTQFFTNAQGSDSTGIFLYTICKYNIKHTVLAIDTKYRAFESRNVCGVSCCAFSLVADAKQSQNTAQKEQYHSPTAKLDVKIAYVHPCATEIETCCMLCTKASVSVLARPEMSSELE